MALLNLQDISLSFGGPPLLDKLSMQVHDGEKIGLLGRNGAGKSSLMKIIEGIVEPDTGSIIADKNIKITRMPQGVPDDLHGSIYDIIKSGIGSHDDFTHKLDNYAEQYSIQQIERVLSLMSLDGDRAFEALSAGMKRRVLLGRSLVNDPDILLLDEPTNHLDIDSIKWLEDFLKRYDKTLIFVTHDRMFLQKITTRIIELDRGKIIDWNCDYKTFMERKAAMLENEEVNNALFDKKLAREETWVRKGIKARRTRNEGRVRALKKMREERKERREQTGTVSMEIQEAERSGKMVAEVTDISFAYGDTVIVDHFSTLIQRHDRIGIIGPNGCGKSTLIKLLIGELEPAEGTVRLGTRLEKSYFDQLRGQLDPDRTVKENVTDGNEIIDFNGKQKHVVGYLQDFLFSPDRIAAKVEVLSGGEKNRLLLARLFTRPSNLLILDEPTNDLDLETVELLEELLLDYNGTLLLVSHDRTFLNNVVTSTIAFEGNGVVKEYVGGYDEWIAARNSQPREKKEKKIREKTGPQKIKLSFKEKRELEELPELLEDMERKKEELCSRLADPALYQNEGELVPQLKDELAVLEQELEELFLRWDELEAKKAVMENG